LTNKWKAVASIVLLTSTDCTQLACLNDHNKCGFFGGPAFIQRIRAI